MAKVWFIKNVEEWSNVSYLYIDTLLISKVSGLNLYINNLFENGNQESGGSLTVCVVAYGYHKL